MSSLDMPERTHNSDRMIKIGRALYRCIREQGYASTKLQDIAKQAEMSPSHVRYYFTGKQAILEWYFEQTSQGYQSGMKRLVASTPADPIVTLSRGFFPESPQRRANLGVFIELRTLALHHPALLKQLKEHDRIQIGFIAELLAPVTRDMDPVAVAEIAYSLAQGLYMGETLQRFATSSAHEYFAATLRALIDSQSIPNASSENQAMRTTS
ncbi:MAG: TetR/AcrR family transcriptional regulator [Pseudomonadota bacterium]